MLDDLNMIQTPQQYALFEDLNNSRVILFTICNVHFMVIYKHIDDEHYII